MNKPLNIIKALGDESRLLILDALREKPKYVEELSERLKLAVSTVSFHLKKLEAAGLVSSAKEQYYTIYTLNDSLLKVTLKELISSGETDRTVQDSRMSAYRNKIIKTFFSRGKLQKLPAQYKKKLIILEEILRKFDKDKAYPEREVDEIISGVYDDYCTVRRYFIDEKMMSRKNGIYAISKTYIPQFPAEAKRNIERKERKAMDKSAIKKEYKLKGPQMGVYTILNPDTGNLFIGSARNVDAIINRHKFELSTRTHSIPELQESWNKFGEKNLKFEITDILKPKEEGYDYREDLKELENLWFEKMSNERDGVIRMKYTGIKS
jgi:biotin operon repressor